MRIYCLFALFVLLSACASAPKFDTTQVDPTLTPKRVAADVQKARGKTVLWGGMILATHNLKETTQLEVLAYPLDENTLPQKEDEPMGRFIIQHRGFLEPATYAQGRLVSVVGVVSGTRIGKVGESDYTYPVIDSRQMHLWPKDSGPHTRFHFGIGVIF